eukprot:gene26997-33206_t
MALLQAPLLHGLGRMLSMALGGAAQNQVKRKGYYWEQYVDGIDSTEVEQELQGNWGLDMLEQHGVKAMFEHVFQDEGHLQRIK